MRKKICTILNKIYGLGMMISFFGGLVPLIPFIIAIIIGGDTGEAIGLFLYNKVYPYVIMLASVSVLIGVISTYISGEKK